MSEPNEGCGDGDYAAGVLLAVVGLGALEDPALVGDAADLEGLAVEVFRAQGQNLAEAHAGVGEGADQGLVTAGAALAKRCISSKVNTRMGRRFFFARGSLARMRSPLKG